MKRFEKHWDQYRKQVIPSEASALQISETRRAFYGGAQALMAEIFDMLSPGAEPTDDDIAKMREIHEEFQEFLRSIKAMA